MAAGVWHYAPGIREMENARVSAGNIQNLASVGYTERKAAEGVSVPTPVTTAAGGLGNWIFLGSVYTPTL